MDPAKKPLYFNPPPPRRQHFRQNKPERNTNIYTQRPPFPTPPLPFQFSRISNYSQTSNSSQSSIKNNISIKVCNNNSRTLNSIPFRNHLQLINPKPRRALPSFISPQPKPVQQYKSPQKLKLQELYRKVGVLRRTVSQNKIGTQIRIDELTNRVKRLRQEYQHKEHKLNNLVHAINHNFP